MERNRKQAIRKWHNDLRTEISVWKILPDLHKDAGGFLTDVENDQVRSAENNPKQVDELVEILVTKETAHFDVFCAILERHDYMTWAKKLKETAGM